MPIPASENDGPTGTIAARRRFDRVAGGALLAAIGVRAAGRTVDRNKRIAARRRRQRRLTQAQLQLLGERDVARPLETPRGLTSRATLQRATGGDSIEASSQPTVRQTAPTRAAVRGSVTGDITI